MPGIVEVGLVEELTLVGAVLVLLFKAGLRVTGIGANCLWTSLGGASVNRTCDR